MSQFGSRHTTVPGLSGSRKSKWPSRRRSASGSSAAFITSAAPRYRVWRQSRSSTSWPAFATSKRRECFEPLAALDYLYAPYLPEEMHWFCKPHPSSRTHHLHLVPAGSQRYVDELTFRDRLRADPKLASDYAALKRKLSERFAWDREAYTEAKSDFICSVLRSA